MRGAWELGGGYECSGVLSRSAQHAGSQAAYGCASVGAKFSVSTVGSVARTLLQHTRVPTHLASVQFDAQGALLACALSTGGVTVLDVLHLRCCLQHQSTADDTVVAPLLRLAPSRAAEAVRWSPASQDLVATVSATDSEAHLFDLGVCDEAPTEVLLGEPTQSARPGAMRAASGGLSDVAFFTSDSRKVLAAGSAGKVLLWDTRCGRRQRASLSAPRSSGQLLSLQLSADDQVVFAAGDSGDIYCWDLRGGRQSTAFLAPNQVTYPFLHTVSIAALLLDVPTLAQEVDVEPSAVHALALDPLDNRRLAFQLARGWSGVVDLAALAVTHVHCPPPPWLLSTEPHTAAQHASWTIRHRPAWSHDAASFLTGTHASAAVHMLDFASTPAAGCHVADSACACAEDATCRSCRRPRALLTPATVVAVAAHPMCEDVIAGLQGGNLALVSTGLGGQNG